MTIFTASRAFKRGFSMGFSSPFRVFNGGVSRVSYFPHMTDAEAWREVGELLNQSYSEVGVELGKNTNKTVGKALQKHGK